MTTKEWCMIHQDVTVSMSVDRSNYIFEIKMVDKADERRVSERKMDFKALPFEQGELVLDDYLCSIYEQLYREIVSKRG